jgi:transposase
MEAVKQCIGIDVSKDFLDCCIGSVDSQQRQIFTKAKKFSNNEQGYVELLQWFDMSRQSDEVIFIMEATGVYYEALAYWLYNHDHKLCVLLPNKVKHYARSLNIKTKTDSRDASLLSQLGLERKLSFWQMPSKMMREIKFLSREYREAKAKLVLVKNQLHAKNYSYRCPQSTEKRLERQIALLETQLLEIEAELRMQVMADSTFYDRVNRICTIPGVSFMTIVCVLSETNAFALVNNAKQLVSYAGLDIQHNQSGLKEGKTKISKKGNSFIRNTLYMPALCASKHNPTMKNFYNKLSGRKPAKKIAVTAVARKLLILIYVIWKNDAEYNPDYEQKLVLRK